MAYVLLIFVIAIVVLIAIDKIRTFQRKRRNFKRSIYYNDKQAAIETHSKQLGKKLQERYGVRDKYPPDKIKATIKDSGWSGDRDCYGIAMYSDRDDFIEYHRSIGEVCDYDAMRSEISECLSLPDNTFSTFEAIEAGALVSNYDTPTYESNSSSEDGGGWSFWGSGDGGGSSSYDGGSSSSYDSGSSDSGSSSDGGGGGDSSSSSD
jgi:hypothetical protein